MKVRKQERLKKPQLFLDALKMFSYGFYSPDPWICASCQRTGDRKSTLLWFGVKSQRCYSSVGYDTGLLDFP